MPDWDRKKARELYDANVPRSEIARRVGASKNALVGVITREKWPKREIDTLAYQKAFRPAQTKNTKPLYAPKTTLPPLASLQQG